MPYQKGFMHDLNSLTSLDKIYCGCYNGDVYSYDGVKSEKVCNVNSSQEHVSPVMSLESIEDSDGKKLYAGRLNEDGILVVPLDNPQDQYTILKNKAFEVSSMALVPLEFIDGMNKKSRAPQSPSL